MTVEKNGQRIADIEDWAARAGPKSPDQWKDGRSAKEVARAWLTHDGTLPNEVQELFSGSPAFSAIKGWKAEPEVRLAFDAFLGEPRNTDMLVVANDCLGRYIVAVEAKADEPFGETVAMTLAAAMERKIVNSRSNGIGRVEQLVAALLGPRLSGEPALADLRYQLLTATAGALCEAERQQSDRAVLVIHEFVTAHTQDANHEENQRDLNRFARRISHGAITAISPGRLHGPISVPGNEHIPSDKKLYIAKAVRNLRDLV